MSRKKEESGHQRRLLRWRRAARLIAKGERIATAARAVGYTVPYFYQCIAFTDVFQKMIEDCQYDLARELVEREVKRICDTITKGS